MSLRIKSTLIWPALVLLLAACGPAATPDPGGGAAPPAVATADEPEPAATEAVTEAEPAPPPDPGGGDEAEAAAAAEADEEASAVTDLAEPGGSDEAASITVEGVTILTEDDRPDGLRAATRSWNTNWNKHTIEYTELLSGGPPRDGIPAVDDPQFISQEEAQEWLADNEPVVAFEIDGEAKAYPLQILIWHEIVNDVVADVPVAITFCPLCNAAIAFDRRLDGDVLDFGTSGLLRNSDLVMYDRQTESLWQQLTGEAIIGDLTGARLTFLPASIVGFKDFKAAHPGGAVLSRETGARRPYGENPYVGYDTIGQQPFLFRGETDGRLPAMERVVAVTLGQVDVAYPLSTLTDLGVIHDTQAGQDLVVFHTPGTSSALGARMIALASDVGATGVFDPNLDGQQLTFTREGQVFTDEQTGSTWNVLGQATDGPLAGQQLTPVIHADHFWFAWAAFKPETIIYTNGN